MPRLVQFTTRVHSAARARRVSGRKSLGTIRPSSSQAHRAAARSTVRLATKTLSAPAWMSLGATALAAPPAPSSSTFLPSGSMSTSRRAWRKPTPSVLYP